MGRRDSPCFLYISDLGRSWPDLMFMNHSRLGVNALTCRGQGRALWSRPAVRCRNTP